jgi:hypothetical protein
MTNRQVNEKEEKQEKQEEKDEKEEKNWDEKWRRDPLSAAVWAGILVWAGLVFLADNLGLLIRVERLDAWGLIFIGAGLLVLLEVVVRLLVPTYRRPVTGTLIFGIFLLGVGLGNLVGWEVIWPVVLIIIGLSILVRGFLWRR